MNVINTGELRAVGETGVYVIKATEKDAYHASFQPHAMTIEHGDHESLFVVMEVCERHALAEANK